MHTEWWAVGLVIVGTLIGSFGALFLKLGTDRITLTPLNILLNGRICLGVLLYMLSTPFFIYALRGGELSVLYPMVALSYIWVTINAKVFLKESINRYKVCGISFIVLGVALIGTTLQG